MTILQAISLLPPVMGAEITCQKLLPIVIHSSKEMAAEIICKKLLPVAINSSMDMCVTRDGGGVEVQGRGEQRGHKARWGGCTGTLGGVEAVVRGARDGTTEEMLPLLGREAHDDTIDLVDGLLLQHERHKALNRGHGYDIMWRGAQGRHRVFPMAIEGRANDVLTHGGCGGRERGGAAGGWHERLRWPWVGWRREVRGTMERWRRDAVAKPRVREEARSVALLGVVQTPNPAAVVR
jgi:hypothetical protein